MKRALTVTVYNQQREKCVIFTLKYVFSGILLCTFITSVKTKCTEKTCGICGVCVNDSCETKFFIDLFEAKAAECKIKNHCTENKCVNGKCISTFGSYYCKCLTGFEGQSCDIRKEKENEPSVIEEVQLVYTYILPVLERGIIILSSKNVSKNVELEIVFRANERYRYDHTSMIRANPQEVCSEHEIPDKVCKTLPAGETYIRKFFLLFPYYRGNCDGTTQLVTVNAYDIRSNKIQFSVKYQVFVKYDCESLKCCPLVELLNCDKTTETSTKFYRNEQILIESFVTPNTGCPSNGMKRSWTVKKHSKNYMDVEAEHFDFEDEDNHIIFKPFSLLPAHYRIRLHVYHTVQSQEYRNLDTCFIEVVTLPLYAVIQGGALRNIDSKDDLILDASESYDPNENENNQGHLRFTWWCDIHEPICNRHVTKDKKYIIKGPFIPDRTYVFTLEVQAVSLSATTNQTISVTTHSGIILTIQCQANCAYQDHLSNPSEEILLNADITAPTIINLSQFLWTYSENSGPEKSVEKIRQQDTDPQVLIIKKNMLLPGKKYYFFVSGKEAGQKSGILIKTAKTPKMGKCAVLPTSGEPIKTLFNITCTDFEDENYTELNTSSILKYEFYDAKPNDNRRGTLLDINTSGNVIGVPLTGGIITIYVTNSFGAFVKQRVTARVSLRKFTDEELNKYYSAAVSLKQYGDVKGSLRLLSAVANIIEDDNKSDMTKNVLGILSQVRLHGLTEIQMVSYALEVIVGERVTNETIGPTPDSVELVASLMKTLMTNFQRGMLATSQPAETVRQREQIVSSIMKCSSAVVSYSDPMLMNKPEDSYRTDLVPMFQRATDYMIDSLHLATQTAGYCLLPSVDPFVIRTENILLLAKVDSIDRIMKLSEFPEGENYSVVIPSSLASALGAKKRNILIQIASFKRNPYWWSQEDVALETDILSFKMSYKSSDKHLEPIRELPEPVKINFNFKGRKKDIVSGSVTFPDSNEPVDKKDLCVAVHRINPPSDISNGRIYIRFLNLKETDTFRVQILKNMRPDYESLMSEGKIVNNNFSEMYTDYSNMYPDVFNYVGILPGSQVTAGVAVNYSFEIFSVHCITRSGVMWTGESIKIADNTTEHKLSCFCQHLSIFGGLFRVPPNELNIFSDMKMFLTILDNPAVPALIACLIVLFLILLAWSSFRDSQDYRKRDIIILEDNFPGERWAYLITVQTGFRFSSETTANVGIQLIGTDGISRAHILRSSRRKTQTWSSDDWFLMFAESSLGHITKIHIWQDYSGSRPSWYCDTVVVHDIANKQTYVFIVRRWFSLEEKVYSVEATIKVAKPDERNERFGLILENTIFGFRESHTWTSIVLRHPRSTTKRTDRLAIAMCNVMTTMLTSIIFFGADSIGGPGIDIPIFSYSLNEFVVGLQSSLISMPMTFVLLFCFRKSCRITIKIVREDEGKKREEQSKSRKLYTTLVHKFVDMSLLLPVGTNKIKSTYEERSKMWYILSWFMCCIIICVCSFFIILYGLKFGKVRSELWIAAVITAVLHDIFILTPLKILLSSFLLSLTLDRLYDISSFQCNLEDVSREKYVGDRSYMEKLLALRSLPMYHPLPKLTVRVLRMKQRRKQRIWMIVEFIIMLVLFVIICLIASNLWTASNYYSNSHLLSLVTTTEQQDGISFSYIMKSSRFMDYITSALLPAVYPQKSYKNDNISSFREVYWTSDHTTNVLNQPQLRQVRVNQEHCRIPSIMSTFGTTCYPHLCGNTEDKRNYSKYWKTTDSETSTERHPWTFTSEKYSHSILTIGKSGTVYYGRGYIAKLDYTHKKSSLIVHDLKESRWINIATRAVFVELLLYNVNVDTITGIILATEHFPSSYVLTWKKILSANVYYFISNIIVIGLLILFVLFLIRIVLLINKTGILKYFSHLWHILEFVLIIIGISFVTVYFVYYYHTSIMIQHFQLTSNYFLFFSLFYYSRVFYSLMFMLVSLFTLKILKSCKFGPKFSTFGHTFKLIKKAMFFVCVTLFLIFNFQILLYYLTNDLELGSLHSVIYNKSYSLMHHSSFLITFTFLFLYSIISVLSLVLVIYYWESKASSDKNSFNYFTFIIDEVKTCLSKRKMYK